MRVPGFLHDGVVTLLEQHPELLVAAWSCLGDGSVDDATVNVLPNALRLTFGTSGVRQIQPDLVLRVDRPGQPPRFGCAEIVSTPTPRRPATWHAHAALLEQTFGERDPLQLVISLGPSMERWVTRQTRGRSGISHVRVLGPSRAAHLSAHVGADPYGSALLLAILREQATSEACEATVRALLCLDDPFSGDYLRMILTAVPDPELRKELLMLVRTRVIEIDEADRQGFLYRMAFEDGREEGREAGREEGREAGREEGREAGREEGREAGRVEMLVKVLAARGFDVASSLDDRLRECSTEQLDRAVLLAVAAPTLDEFERVFFGGATRIDG